MLGCAVFGLPPALLRAWFGLTVVTCHVFCPLVLSAPFIRLKTEEALGRTTEQFMTVYSENILNQYITESYILKRIEPFLNIMKDRVTHICEKVVPKIINADKMFITNSVKEKLSVIDVLKECRPIQSRCEMLLGKIEILLVEYFPASEMSFQYIHNAKLQHEIGQGAFSNVQSAIISINNKETLVAVKTLKEPLESMHSYKLLSEALILRKLNNEHQNILKMYGISLLKCEGKTFLQIFMEHCDDSLHDIVMKKRNPVPCGNLNRFPDCKESWSFVESIMKGLCSAFEYMHGAGFVHRDLKLANIMVKENHKVRLADFGLSKREDIITGTIVGTQLYMSPEVWKGELYGTEADIYSLGMVLYELWYYRPVYTRPLRSNPSEFEYIFHTVNDFVDYVVTKGRRPDCKIPLAPPKELTALLTSCWEADIHKRPTAAEVYRRLLEVKFD